MARAKIIPQNQLERINRIRIEVVFFKEQDKNALTKRPRAKGWSIIEVFEHMVIASKAYEDKIDNCLLKLNASPNKTEEIKARAIPSFLIKRFPPKENKIRFKMKTFKKFQPMFSSTELSDEEIKSTFDNFILSLDHLEKAIKRYPTKSITDISFNSAIGATVRFNVAEACEFILCHNERHLLQASNTLRSIQG
jgi:hypothetical protein